jgi:hypothetical protein
VLRLGGRAVEVEARGDSDRPRDEHGEERDRALRGDRSARRQADEQGSEERDEHEERQEGH